MSKIASESVSTKEVSCAATSATATTTTSEHVAAATVTTTVVEAVSQPVTKCSGCNKEKPHKQFSRTQLSRRLSTKTHAEGNKGYCKQCISEYNRQRRYSLTPAALHDMLTAQKQKCALPFCTIRIDEKTAQVDHDHHTGKVRGLLCVGCNTSIGGLHDLPETVLSTVVYLLKTTSAVSETAKVSMTKDLAQITQWLVDTPLLGDVKKSAPTASTSSSTTADVDSAENSESE